MSALAHLEGELTPQHAVLLAYSGGLDSSVLLHQLVLLRESRPQLQLRAVHIHHGLSPLADSWVQHCRQQCAAWQVPFEVIYVQIDAREGGIEAAARAARYQALRQRLKPGEALLTAQHQDDQCETLLLALKRGSGPAGLAGMPGLHQQDGYHHLRPLLAHSRAQLEAWAQQYQLSWIEDDSNQDDRYERNFLRLRVLPALNARWPHFSRSVARSAELCGEQEQLLDELLAESLAELVNAEGALLFTPLLTMSEPRRFALIRRWIAGQGGMMPSRAAIQRIWLEVACSREDAEPCFRLGNHEVRRFRERLYWLLLLPPLSCAALEWASPWQPLSLPARLGTLRQSEAGIALRRPLPDEAVSVRFQSSAAVHVVGRAGSRSLKKLWQEFGIPPWQRGRIPLIFYGERLIAAAGVFVTRDGVAQRPEESWRIAWCRLTENGEQQ